MKNFYLKSNNFTFLATSIGVFVMVLVVFLLNPQTTSAIELNIDLINENNNQTIALPSYLSNNLIYHQDLPESRFFLTQSDFADFLANPNPKNHDWTWGDKNFYQQLAQFAKTEMPKHFTEKPSQDATWEEEDGVVKTFTIHQNGYSYDLYQAVRTILKHQNPEEAVAIKVVTLPPSNRLQDLNPYGIAELIARGDSNFAGSSNSRIVNIQVSTSRYHGQIIKPGETFSFNDLLGPVNAAHGFTPELVIKQGALVTEFGGGICQVSTTVFRTALEAGVPITERRAHSFAVSYYDPQGTDATIYPGSQDLKFLNDTPGHLLIWARIEGHRLIFEFYGQTDGREVMVGTPWRYNIQNNGAFSAALERTVVYANQEKNEEIFRSHYRPPAEFVQTTTAQEPVPEQNESE